jgi:hypothetical protein
MMPILEEVEVTVNRYYVPPSPPTVATGGGGGGGSNEWSETIGTLACVVLFGVVIAFCIWPVEMSVICGAAVLLGLYVFVNS